jgi:hypothetical protein
MKAISLWEPWASAMSLGMKRNETRSWPTNYRGDIAICAAKRPIDAFSWKLVELLGVDVATWQPPYGCVLCVVELVECVETVQLIGQPRENSFREMQEELWGNYSPGRWFWITRNLRRLARPVPVVGRQGLFNLPPAVEAQVRQQTMENPSGFVIPTDQP